MKCTLLVVFLFVAVVYGQEPTHLPGGRVPVEPNNEILVSTLSAVERKLDESINSPFVHRIGKVVEASSQVVAGIKFYVTFELNETTCKKSVTTDVSSCNTYSKTEKCYAEIWTQPWAKHTELVTLRC